MTLSFCETIILEVVFKVCSNYNLGSPTTSSLSLKMKVWLGLEKAMRPFSVWPTNFVIFKLFEITDTFEFKSKSHWF